MPAKVLAALVATAVALVPGLSPGRSLPAAPSCPVFPADNPWNLPVDQLPVRANSDAIVRSIGLEKTLHADFGSGRYQGAPIGIPFVVVGPRQKRVPVRFQYADESDRGRYPIPPKAPIEGGPRGDGDRHPQARVVLEALKRYGMIMADNGSDWFISGAPNARWDNDDLRALGQVPGSAFEVVDTSRLPRPRLS